MFVFECMGSNLCIRSKFFVGFFFKHLFPGCNKNFFCIDLLVSHLWVDGGKKSNQKNNQSKKIKSTKGCQEAKLFSAAADDGDTGENRKPSLGLVLILLKSVGKFHPASNNYPVQIFWSRVSKSIAQIV